MGPCGSKYETDSRRRSTLYGRRNTLIIRPKINIAVGECIDQQAWQGHTKIIFIFGGPGTGKGTIITNLMQMYGIHLVNAEDLLLNKLYDVVIKPTESDDDVDKHAKMSANATKEINRYIMENPDEVSRRSLFELISDEIAKFPKGDVILVDIVPNLKFLLRCSAFVQKDSDNSEIERFETKYPIRFAINLQLEKEQLINNIALTHACTRGVPVKEGSVAAPASQSDEIDMSRTERRFNIYINSVEEFLSYFNNKGKLLAVDTSTCDVEAVWMAIRDYVVDSEIASPVEGIEQVVLFQLADNDFTDVDTQRYPMMPLSCQSLASGSANPEELLKSLVSKMRENAVHTKAFLLDCLSSPLCDVEKLTKAFDNKHSLIFLEEEVGTLDFFLHGLRRRTSRKKSIARKNAQLYKTVTTGDNEALIFPLDTDPVLCRLICNGFVFSK